MHYVQFITRDRNRDLYVCQLCEEDCPDVTIRMTHSSLKQLREMAARVLALDFREPVQATRYVENFDRLQQLCDRVIDAERREAKADDEPFLTPREFALFVAGLRDRTVAMRSVDGYTIEGQVRSWAAGELRVFVTAEATTYDLDPSEVADLVVMAPPITVEADARELALA